VPINQRAYEKELDTKKLSSASRLWLTEARKEKNMLAQTQLIDSNDEHSFNADEPPFQFLESYQPKQRSGCMGKELAIEALQQGATDYAFKTRLSRIAPCVRRALSEVDSVFFRRDLEIAKNVQEASFPQRPPAIPGLNCSTFYKPAHSVGGDYYDFLPLKDGAWGIAIGDVSGKGIGAALVMASLQASLRAQTLHPRSDLEMHVTYLNKLIFESCPANFFASLFYAEYEPA
jgi:sigma-B regulation protein RsbU (phosphoserine phosphatase)